MTFMKVLENAQISAQTFPSTFSQLFSPAILTIQRALSARRFLSATPQRSNLISELYVSQIKQFKPTQTSSDVSEAVKKFQLPAKPSIPSEEVTADAVSSYESAAVETASSPSSASEPAAEEDWFVFEEAEAEHH
ncbi:hypothetical protein OXX59_005750 [Metschnikowia pulcherrima]